MNCEDCQYKKFDHYVEGAPRAVYTCTHPEAGESENCPREWKLKYITRLINQGLTPAEAEENYENGDHDFDDSPEDQADDLISYYREEGR